MDTNSPGLQSTEFSSARLEGERLKHALEVLEISIGDVATEEDVETIALEVLDCDEQALFLLGRVKLARDSGGDDVESVVARKKILDNIKIEIGLICGVEIEASEHASQRTVYRERAGRILSVLQPGISDEDLMVAIGMITPVEGKKGHVFIFPYKFFPPYIKQQWESYTAIVEQQLAGGNKLKKGIITQTDFDTVDFMRGKAHNTVAQSVGDFFDFPDWGLRDYRHFVSKMLDEKFVESVSELHDTARALRGYGSEHLRAARDAILRHRRSDSAS